jgi:hypothetical protein
VRRAIRATGAKLFFLPPYSPDLNPIEQMFAKLKTLLRNAAARSVEATWKGIGRLLKEFSPHECANYLANAGYAATYGNQALVVEHDAATHYEFEAITRLGVDIAAGKSPA